MVKNKVEVSESLRQDEIVLDLLGELLINGYIIVNSEYSGNRIDVAIFDKDDAKLCRKNQKYKYSMIVVFIDNIEYWQLRQYHADAYVLKVNDNLNLFTVKNSELFNLAEYSKPNGVISNLFELIHEKCTRHSLPMITDKSPKDLKTILSDEQKAELMLLVNECWSFSLRAKINPENVMSNMIAYKCLKRKNNNSTIIAYFDNINGVIRYSEGKNSKSHAKAPFDLIAHQSIQQALAYKQDCLVLFNEYNYESELYNVSDNVALVAPFAISDSKYYYKLGLCTIDNFKENEILSIVVPNRGVFQIVPLTLGNDFIINELQTTNKVKSINQLLEEV